MKKLTALLVLMLTMVLSILPAQAEVERSKLLDAAFSMLEEGNDFVRRYNEMTGRLWMAARISSAARQMTKRH